VSFAVGFAVSINQAVTRYGTSTYVTAGDFAGCYSNSKYSYYVCYSRKVWEDCTYTYDWDFNKGRNDYFWKCYDD